MLLVFKKIENQNIFTRDFSPFARNNEIHFSGSQNIAVIYGPNGTGKSSLIKVLESAPNTKVEFSLEGRDYQDPKSIFHVINDQNNRNIINGEARDFLLGDNIQREFELQKQVEEDRKKVIGDILQLIKTTFNISSASSPLIGLLSKRKLIDFIKDCANSRSKGSSYTAEDLINLLQSLTKQSIPHYDENKLLFLQKDLADKNSIIKKFEELMKGHISPNIHVTEIEENTEAIKILDRFQKDQCIVCDNQNIDRKKLLAQKTTRKKETLEALDDKVRQAIEQAVNILPSEDPFGIKQCLLNAVSTGSMKEMGALARTITGYKNLYSVLLENNILELTEQSPLFANYAEYERILQNQPTISDEDCLYIQEIISNSMNKTLKLDRDPHHHLRIVLNDQEFLETDRKKLPLSTGEQNFLSLTFEFLKAKNSDCSIVVIDDPVSSFDSIYKNKVVYAIAKILHNKKRIILTHNLDLVRLLEGQHKGSFKLYLLNNTEDGDNGFVPLSDLEKGMLISLEKLLKAFREQIPQEVRNKELFLISMIPFMRGYANIINNKNLFEELTEVMHGYKTGKVDIAKAYSELFGRQEQSLPSSYQVSVKDILTKTVDGVHLVNEEKFPLLDRTLCHSFEYLFLRLCVEKNLVEKFNIDTRENKQLGQIIDKAFPNGNDPMQIRYRIRLTSKKTLINEFNHFEGNLSIFQPAIDITDQALGKERTDIMSLIRSL